MSDVFKALADDTRRILLDQLFDQNGQTLRQLTQTLSMSRQAVSKHLKILEAANLITIHWQGREKLHFINPVPIAEIVHRWVGRFEEARLDMLVDLKTESETKEEKRNAL
ncbi:ArsR/SmtB family transcription factor [Robiginitomaculum antarcticum]|uniref:ArsR/SmtB family transcription factor n=1 Tax=Robiginitomaculum antarcticum TaxID=437507 RepID=UPI000381AC6C|nr:helix-turn-helix transcriptional regulator [Robiginitomaculum antarcticum]